MRQGNGLAAILVRGYLRNDLCGNVAGSGKAVRPLDKGTGNDGAILQHILQIDQITVMHMLGKIVAVVEVDDPLPVSFHDLSGQQQALTEIPRHFTSHIIPLGRIDHRVFIGVFLLGLLVAAFNKAEDLVVSRIAASDERAGIAVGNIIFLPLHRRHVP